MPDYTPASFSVFVTFPHQGKPYTMRVGNYKTLDAARAGIAEEKRALGDTLSASSRPSRTEVGPTAFRSYRLARARGVVMATVRTEAYDHGALAYKRGQFLKDNPYGRGGFAHIEWMSGWKDARVQARALHWG